jgi:hypothetical protein
MKILGFFFYFCGSFLPSLIRIRNLNADPDPATQINADPCGSGSETPILYSDPAFFISVIDPDSLDQNDSDPQQCWQFLYHPTTAITTTQLHSKQISSLRTSRSTHNAALG